MRTFTLHRLKYLKNNNIHWNDSSGLNVLHPSKTGRTDRILSKKIEILS